MTISRRQILKGAGASAAVFAADSSWSFVRAANRRPTVAVFGGGIGGLTTAHELAERGFDVTVYEARAWGGKVRSHTVPGTGTGGRGDLPGEHSPHAIYGWYQNLPDTMRRIPVHRNPNGALDGLIPLDAATIRRTGAGQEFSASLGPETTNVLQADPDFLLEIISHLPPNESAYLAERLGLYMSSCDARRFGQWEHQSWWEFTGAEHMSRDYQLVVVDLMTRVVFGQPVRSTSARVAGSVTELIFHNLFGMTGDRVPVSTFAAPKNEVFIDPWCAHLARLGVRLELGTALTGFTFEGGRIRAAEVRDGRGPRPVTADYYVCALPVEKAGPLFSPALREADPRLDAATRIPTRWCNGMQFYLREPVAGLTAHEFFLDSPWALITFSASKYWPNRDIGRAYGDGFVREILSVAISDLDIPGVVYGRPVRESTAEEVATECWVQMQRHLTARGEPRLPDDLIVTWKVDPGLVPDAATGRLTTNHDPLCQTSQGVWDLKPDAATAIPNLVLAADYVRVNNPLTCTDGANEAGRRAANAVIDASGSRADPVPVLALPRPPEFDALRAADEQLYRAGLPHPLDLPALARPVGAVTDILSTTHRYLRLR